jgi:hypothetical protein
MDYQQHIKSDLCVLFKALPQIYKPLKQIYELDKNQQIRATLNHAAC